MNPYTSYRRHEPAAEWTRIETVLALFDGALDRLDKAEAALRRSDEPAAVPLVARAQLIVAELAAGVRVDANQEVGTNLLRLYEFAANELRRPRAEGIANARKVLRTLREGFEAVRAQANAMERGGQLPPASRMQVVHATA